MDNLDFIIRAESGDVDHDELVAGVQALIDDGTVWHLQGSWGRLAAQLIDCGACHVPKRTTH